MTQPDLSAVVHTRRVVGGVRLHCAELGVGEPIVLLHGFPEFWYSWRRQMPALAAAGFHAVAPDLRGYNESDRPGRVRDYRTSTLVGDVARLIRSLTDGPACVVGHDWGGVIAWKFAATHPELVRKLVILNAPHPAAFRRELRRSPRQWLRSAYVLFFQLPWLPERLIRASDFALLKRAWRTAPVRRDAFTDADIAEYKRAFGRPGGLTGPLNYYRAAMRYPRDSNGGPETVTVQTLLIWGERDPYLGIGLTHGLEKWVPDLRVERISESSHWVQNDAPARVNELLVRFFKDNGASPARI